MFGFERDLVDEPLGGESCILHVVAVLEQRCGYLPPGCHRLLIHRPIGVLTANLQDTALAKGAVSRNSLMDFHVVCVISLAWLVCGLLVFWVCAPERFLGSCIYS